jgi:hypothetical protein
VAELGWVPATEFVLCKILAGFNAGATPLRSISLGVLVGCHALFYMRLECSQPFFSSCPHFAYSQFPDWTVVIERCVEWTDPC